MLSCPKRKLLTNFSRTPYLALRFPLFPMLFLSLTVVVVAEMGEMTGTEVGLPWVNARERGLSRAVSKSLASPVGFGRTAKFRSSCDVVIISGRRTASREWMEGHPGSSGWGQFRAIKRRNLIAFRTFDFPLQLPVRVLCDSNGRGKVLCKSVKIRASASSSFLCRESHIPAFHI